MGQGIRPDLIAPQWDDILRFVATIKLKEATASQLFKRTRRRNMDLHGGSRESSR